jgi:hypothetical protein
MYWGGKAILSKNDANVNSDDRAICIFFKNYYRKTSMTCEKTINCSFEKSLNACDGKKYFSGEWSESISAKKISCNLSFAFKDKPLTFLRIEVSPFFVTILPEFDFLSVARIHPDNTVESSFVKLYHDKENQLSLEYSDGKIVIVLNSQATEFHSRYSPPINSLGLHCDNTIEIIDFKIEDFKAANVSPPVPSSEFHIDMCTDFSSEMIPSVWNREMLTRFMQAIHKLGIRRINWIYHGNKSDGFWDSGWSKQANINESIRNLGDSFFKAAVEEAHSVGLKIYAVFKPFDMGIVSFPIKGAISDEKMPTLGGHASLRFNFPAEHPELCMQRHPTKDGVPARIVLNSQRSLSTTHGFKLWAGDDNRNYRDTGLISYPDSTCRSVTFNIDGLGQKYFAIQSLSETERNQVFNTQNNFIKAYDRSGKEIDSTLGLAPRQYLTELCNNHQGARTYDYGNGFSGEGFIFDSQMGIPSCIWCGEYSSKSITVLNRREGVIGVAIGANPWIPGVMCPSEKKARQYWLKVIADTVGYGADGVDIRISNHSSILSWAKYGFNPVIREEYLRRYGADPATGPYDNEKLRVMRGEFYTLFLQEAANLAHKNGKAFAVHIPDMAFGTPDVSTMMEIDWNWRSWIEKNIPDEVTFKCLSAESPFTDTAAELLQLCRDRKIPVTVSPFIHHFTKSKANLETYLESNRERGFSGFNVYESATMWRAGNNGLEELHPQILRTISKISARHGK